MPAPNVDSAVIKIEPNPVPRLDEESEKFFFKIVKSGFSQRRKTAANALSSLAGIPKSDVYEALAGIGFNENARLEQLDMEQLINFSLKLREISN